MINTIKADTTTTTTTGTTTGTGTTAASSSSSSTGVAAGATLGGTNFLTLMLAQLKNQDPTSPVDSNTFLTQLAQLSEVQGINTLNTSFSSLSSALTGAQATQASSLLGHQALVTTSTVNQTAGATVTGAVNVPQTTSSVLVSVTDGAGNTVRTLSLGAQSTGLASFSWDGLESDGSKAPTGTYTLTAQYAGETTKSTAATTAVYGTVESVSMGATGTSGASGMTLNVAGVGSVPYSSLQQISN